MPIRPSRAGGQLKFSRLLNWQISGLRAVEYFGYVEPDLTKISRGVYAVGDESTCLDVTLKRTWSAAVAGSPVRQHACGNLKKTDWRAREAYAESLRKGSGMQHRNCKADSPVSATGRPNAAISPVAPPRWLQPDVAVGSWPCKNRLRETRVMAGTGCLRPRSQRSAA
jgi:hypothetical protein